MLDGGNENIDIASREPWWSHHGGQSENGILVRVETENEEREMRNIVTEVLLYAAVAKTSPALPTPPASSSPAPPDEDPEDALNQGGKTAKVFALPICSNVIGSAKNSMEVCPPTPTEFQNTGQACFLPHKYDLARVTQPAPQKRQSISTLFEDAKKKRRKFKGRGGEDFSQAMASMERLPSQHGLPEKHEEPQSPQTDLRRQSLSQASNMTSVAGPEYPGPVSRSGPLANSKRSSLHRMESAISPRDSLTPFDADGSLAQQNKAALIKVVMAGMRLHGLQQKKRPSSKSQLPGQETLLTETNGVLYEAENEYKLVYHQTFKAAVFTFRKYLNALLISQETMRDVVDRLLTMFCTDPMAVDRVPDDSKFQGFGTDNGQLPSSPFDKPSGQARFSNAANGWNNPTARKL